MRLAHIGWNLGGLTVPLVVAAVTVPQLVKTLGNERFGMLTLAWGLVGYAGALDLGIGRALTQRVARLRGLGAQAAIHGAIATAGRITLVAGVAGGALIALAALCGAAGLFHVATVPLSEISAAMLLLAVALPVQAMSATYRGVNEAFLNFGGINVLRIVLGVLNFGGPFLVSRFTTQLPWLVATLVVSRALALYVFYRLAQSALPERAAGLRRKAYSHKTARSLFAFGGWIAVSSAISPVLGQADRFLIGTALSAAAVTAYVLPYELVVQSLALVGAISSVIFPVLSKMIAERPQEWHAYFRLWLLRVTGLMLVTTVVLALALPTILRLWIGDTLQPGSVAVGQILCIGVFANAVGSMYYALLHAQGRADLTAKLHMLEVPLFVAALLYLLQRWGIEGAAAAWVGRMVFDAGALAWLARRRHA